jgi:hypothetical protein
MSRRNDDPIGGGELIARLLAPPPETRRLADAILDGIGPDVPAPTAISALTCALVEAVIANTSPPEAWAAAIAQTIEIAVRRGKP